MFKNFFNNIKTGGKRAANFITGGRALGKQHKLDQEAKEQKAHLQKLEDAREGKLPMKELIAMAKRGEIRMNGFRPKNYKVGGAFGHENKKPKKRKYKTLPPSAMTTRIGRKFMLKTVKDSNGALAFFKHIITGKLRVGRAPEATV